MSWFNIHVCPHGLMLFVFQMEIQRMKKHMSK